jgi:hypothetical protein
LGEKWIKVILAAQGKNRNDEKHAKEKQAGFIRT